MSNNILEAIVRKTNEAEKLMGEVKRLEQVRDSLSWTIAAAAVTGADDEIYEILAQRDEVNEQIAVLEERIDDCNDVIERLKMEDHRRTERMPAFEHRCNVIDIQLLIDRNGCLRGIKL